MSGSGDVPLGEVAFMGVIPLSPVVTLFCVLFVLLMLLALFSSSSGSTQSPETSHTRPLRQSSSDTHPAASKLQPDNIASAVQMALTPK